MTVFLNLLDLGMSSSIIRFGAEHRGRKAPEETSALASTGLFVYTVSGLATAAVGVGLAFVVPGALGVSHGLVWPARSPRCSSSSASRSTSRSASSAT